MHPLPGCEDSSRAALRHNGDGIMGATFTLCSVDEWLGRLNALFTKSSEMISHITHKKKNRRI